VSDALREHYVAEDGGFVLDAGGIEDTSALRKASGKWTM
jgi:hypothetical protein